MDDLGGPGVITGYLNVEEGQKRCNVRFWPLPALLAGKSAGRSHKPKDVSNLRKLQKGRK